MDELNDLWLMTDLIIDWSDTPPWFKNRWSMFGKDFHQKLIYVHLLSILMAVGFPWYSLSMAMIPFRGWFPLNFSRFWMGDRWVAGHDLTIVLDPYMTHDTTLILLFGSWEPIGHERPIPDAVGRHRSPKDSPISTWPTTRPATTRCCPYDSCEVSSLRPRWPSMQDGSTIGETRRDGMGRSDWGRFGWTFG